MEFVGKDIKKSNGTETKIKKRTHNSTYKKLAVSRKVGIKSSYLLLSKFVLG